MLKVKDLLLVLQKADPELPVYGAANADGFDPANRFPLTVIEFRNVPYGHYTEPVVVLFNNVL